MTRSVLPFAAAVLLGTLASPALAQGTDAQREACAPDAVRLCPDTIPDVGRTTACMRRHQAQLSARCRVVFNDATGGRSERRRVARVAPDADDVPGEKRYLYLSPDDNGRRAAVAPEVDDTPIVGRGPAEGEEVDSDAADVGEARRAIGRLCRRDVLDPGTCAVTRNALDLAE